MTLRVVSYGGGVQSTALLVLAAQGKIDFKTFLFCNVGDDSEEAATLRYVHEVAMPFAVAHGIDLQELHRIKRDGTIETVKGRIMKEGGRSTVIPIRLQSGMPAIRACTNDFKIRLVLKWLKQHGANKHNPAVVGLGISIDEFRRMRTSNIPEETLEYPLIDQRLDRQACTSIISDAGLPVPSKSACEFCPYKKVHEHMHDRKNRPDVFWRNVELERYMSARSQSLGQGPMYLTDKMIPLDQLADQGAFDFEEEDACESGYCMT